MTTTPDAPHHPTHRLTHRQSPFTSSPFASKRSRFCDVRCCSAHRYSPVRGTALALAVDVTDRAAVQAAADQVAEHFGKADLVFNNAGVQLISGIEELKVDDWQRQIDLNISGLMNVIAAFLPHLTDSAAAGRPADLINTSSIAATRILTKFSIYSGTKAYISSPGCSGSSWARKWSAWPPSSPAWSTPNSPTTSRMSTRRS